LPLSGEAVIVSLLLDPDFFVVTPPPEIVTGPTLVLITPVTFVPDEPPEPPEPDGGLRP
jgi:hypothetical protein